MNKNTIIIEFSKLKLFPLYILLILGIWMIFFSSSYSLTGFGYTLFAIVFFYCSFI